MTFSIFIGALVVIYVLSRQLRVRPVPRTPNVRLPVILGVLGLFELVSYTGRHHVTGADYAWFLGTLALGGVLLGALRALTVKIWVANHWVLRQGTGVTMALWVVSLVVHFLGDYGHNGASNLEFSTVLLYMGVTLGVQNAVVHRRALPLWESLGPQAGRGVQVNFGQGSGAFFTMFRGGPGFPPPPPPSATHDSGIIDAEVVEDGDGPAELHHPD